MDQHVDIGRIIKSETCIEEGIAALSALHPQFAHSFSQTGVPPTRLRPDGFAAVLSAIMSQQVSVASARAIWGRLEDAGYDKAHTFAYATEEELRSCGLSRQKIKYAHALAHADIDFDALRNQPTAQVVATLVKAKGIGAWTAEIYAMFSLGRADVFAPGDLALQEGARILFDLPERPNEKALRQMAQAWSPWQSVAARLLWSYYHVVKDREGIS